jgi:Rps23 Pro-64 3,4-dihydroxylase Tpa1-like proline 4-hydroxylase
MIIIDDYLPLVEFKKLKTLVEYEIQNEDRINNKKEHGEEFIDLGLENSKLYVIEEEAKIFLIEKLINSGFLLPAIIESASESQLRYHECKHPFRSLWHKDRHGDWNEPEIDYFGFNFYLHDQWQPDHGGLFLYKEAGFTQGHFVEPSPNRLVINEKDDWHSVSQIIDPTVVRKSLNYFLHVKYQSNDLYRI